MSKMDLWVDDFLSYLASEKGLSKNTLEAYKRDLSFFIGYLERKGCVEISAITKEKIVKIIPT